MSQANAAVMEMPKTQVWRAVCAREDLVLNSGVVALVGNAQVALFYVASIGGAPQLFAVDNRDPVTGVGFWAEVWEVSVMGSILTRGSGPVPGP